MQTDMIVYTAQVLAQTASYSLHHSFTVHSTLLYMMLYCIQLITHQSHVEETTLLVLLLPVHIDDTRCQQDAAMMTQV